jgi:UDP-N-acetylglucosamine--N-acetylmuramyl-(pentapeptide) pyrophosphoryl-undecaprenol N-acetylglucosamine transferase
MKMTERKMKIIISGGGTGGHIFPALAIAEEIKKRHKSANILFVGAKDRMEMEKIPAAGYRIIGLPVAGFSRKQLTKNFSVIFRLMVSLKKAREIIKEFKPDIVVGVGGYASGPMLRTAARLGIPTLIQEQNSYAGITNRLLAKKTQKICVAYPGMDKYFPADKIVLAGNPVLAGLSDTAKKASEARTYFDIEKNKPVLLILGGSLGARTINRSVIENLDLLAESGVTVIWQTGALYHAEALEAVKGFSVENIKIHDFISRMDLAYAIADVIISRAGAGTISEICLVEKPLILVPSPNVAEDHQTKNAMALVDREAAEIVKDDEAVERLLPRALILLKDDERQKQLSKNISKLALPDSAKLIVNEIEKLIQ